MTDSPVLLRISHEIPGVTLIATCDRDIGIDPEWSDPGHYRVFVYSGRWGLDDDNRAVAFNLHGYQDHPENERIGSPFLHRVETRDDDSVYVVLRDGSALMIYEDHVFGYFDDDGDACTVIIHIGPTAAESCDALGCRDDIPQLELT